MADKGKKRGRDAINEIDLQLDGLLGKLGSTIADLVSKLDLGDSGEINRAHSFQTARGPIRAETGIRIRMGGFDTDGAGSPQPVNRPGPASGRPRSPAAGQTDGPHSTRSQTANPDTRSPQSHVKGPASENGGQGHAAGANADGGHPGTVGAAKPARRGGLKPRAAAVSAYVENGRFILTAELPGVSLSEMALRRDGDTLLLDTTGERRFTARVALPAEADLSDIETALHNGILVASIALAGSM